MNAEPTGLDILRDALRARAHKSHLGSLARDLNITVEALDDFARSGTSLSPETMTRLAQDLFGSSSVSFDPQRNLLVCTTPPARPLGVIPPSINQMKLQLPKFTGGPAPPRPRSAAPPGAKQSRRPGWAD
jgi:hypothetical protein